MEENAKKTYYIGINHVDGESCVSTGMSKVAKFLGIHRTTVYNHLLESSHYQGFKYDLYRTTNFFKMDRKLSNVTRNATLPQSVYLKSNKVVDKPVKELTYEPFYD